MLHAKAMSVTMPTKPFLEVFDREFTLDAAKHAIPPASAVLSELVNHGSHACRRCMDAADRTPNVHLAPFSLYRQILEAIDGIQVLLSSSCVAACQAPLRVALESSWQLEYILDKRPAVFDQRSLTWLCHFYRRKVTELDRYSGSADAGRDFKAAWDDEFGPAVPLSVDEEELRRTRQRYETSLRSPTFLEAIEELDRLGSRAPWYRAFDGPANLRELANVVGKTVEYDALYRPLSMIIHGADAEEYAIDIADRKASVRLVRDPHRLPETALLACFTMLGATRVLIGFYRSGEQLVSWYRREIRPFLSELQALRGKVGIRYSLKEE